MEQRTGRERVASWYWIGATASLLFMLLGCAVYAMHLYTDPATLPLDQTGDVRGRAGLGHDDAGPWHRSSARSALCCCCCGAGPRSLCCSHH